MGWAPEVPRTQAALGGECELNVVVGVFCVARFLKSHRRALHAPKGSLPSSKPVRPHGETWREDNRPAGLVKLHAALLARHAAASPPALL